MLSRFLVILFFVPLLIWIFLKGDVTFLIFTEVIIGISMFEFYKMLKDKGYEVLLLDSPIVPHLIQKLETSKEKISFARVDADHINNLIKKDEPIISKLNETEKITIIMITHNRSIAQSADRILKVSDGVLTDLGRCRE